MSGMLRRFVGLCLPPLLCCLLDDTLTLLGQAADYWAGNYSLVNEASPTFNQLLAIHPMAFVAGGFVWAGLFVGIILLLPETLALSVSIAVVFGHTVGAATWLIGRFEYSYQFCNGLFCVAAIVLGVGIRWGWGAAPQGDYGPARIPGLWRWITIAILFGIAVYLYLWPRAQGD